MVLALAGCNQAFSLQETILVDGGPDADLRPDLDHDMIADVEDPCIAAAGDATADTDMDGTPNGMDNCPYWNMPDDTDGDGVGDLCDPFRLDPGDKARCLMIFSSRELNATLWTTRPGEKEIAISSGLLFSFGPGSAIASEQVIPVSSPTVIVDAFIQTFYAHVPHRMGLWLSAGPTPSASDVACEVFSDGLALRSQLTGPAPTMSDPVVVPDAGAYIVRVIMEPSAAGTNVVCAVGHANGVLYTRSHIDTPLGAFGFTSTDGANSFGMLATYTRDDQPALP